MSQLSLSEASTQPRTSPKKVSWTVRLASQEYGSIAALVENQKLRDNLKVQRDRELLSSKVIPSYGVTRRPENNFRSLVYRYATLHFGGSNRKSASKQNDQTVINVIATYQHKIEWLFNWQKLYVNITQQHISQSIRFHVSVSMV